MHLHSENWWGTLHKKYISVVYCSLVVFHLCLHPYLPLLSLSLSLYLFPLPSLSHLFFFSSLHNTAAGDAFRRAAELHMGMETKHEAATHFVEAGLVLKREVHLLIFNKFKQS